MKRMKTRRKEIGAQRNAGKMNANIGRATRCSPRPDSLPVSRGVSLQKLKSPGRRHPPLENPPYGRANVAVRSRLTSIGDSIRRAAIAASSSFAISSMQMALSLIE
jgi:hypothetical protein